MNPLHIGHQNCFHTALFPGCVYCFDSRAVYVEPRMYLKYICDDEVAVLQVAAFTGACIRAYKMLPAGCIQSYVWLSPNKMIPGLDGCGRSNMAELRKRLEGVQE